MYKNDVFYAFSSVDIEVSVVPTYCFDYVEFIFNDKF